jgi:hypothetical protein
MTISKESLEAILQAQRCQIDAWQRVVDCGRQYAMLKATGSIMEDGRRLIISFTRRKAMEDMLRDNMARAAEDAFAEDAIVGAELQNIK